MLDPVRPTGNHGTFKTSAGDSFPTIADQSYLFAEKRKPSHYIRIPQSTNKHESVITTFSTHSPCTEFFQTSSALGHGYITPFPPGFTTPRTLSSFADSESIRLTTTSRNLITYDREQEKIRYAEWCEGGRRQRCPERSPRGGARVERQGLRARRRGGTVQWSVGARPDLRRPDSLLTLDTDTRSPKGYWTGSGRRGSSTVPLQNLASPALQSGQR